MGKWLGLWSGGNRGEIGTALPAGEGETIGDDEADRWAPPIRERGKIVRNGLLGRAKWIGLGCSVRNPFSFFSSFFNSFLFSLFLLYLLHFNTISSQTKMVNFLKFKIRLQNIEQHDFINK
jgi:hypothetical protein